MTVNKKPILPFAILKPVPYQEPRILSLDGDEKLLKHLLSSQTVVVDLETKGNDASDLRSSVVGFSLATSEGAAYFNRDTWALFLQLARNYNTPLIAHNVCFDAAYASRDAGYWHNWIACTYAVYKHMASEGWLDQRWSLKRAQTDLLGWEETNEVELDQWLVDNGYVKQAGRPIKGEMWRAPQEILGKYCALDSASTYDLWTRVLKPAVDYFDVYRETYLPDFMQLIRATIEQQLTGMEVDVKRLKEYSESLDRRREDLRLSFLGHDEVSTCIRRWNEEKVASLKGREPEKYLKRKERKEPPKFKKDGTVSKNWENWKAQCEAEKELAVSKNWEKWSKRFEQAKQEQHFNINSGDQLRWLFFDQLKYTPQLFTENGAAAVDNRAKRFFGEPGRLLLSYDKLTKEQSYVDKALAVAPFGVLHPRFKTPGTLTGRLSGDSGFNCYPEETEVLTRRGWVALKDLVKGEEVWQSNLNGYGSWVVPTTYYSGVADSFIRFGSPRGRACLTVTPNHRMIWANYRGVNRQVSLAADLFSQSSRFIPVSTVRKEDIQSVNYDEISKVLAIQADGSLRKGRPNVYSIGVKKGRKVERLRQLFGPETGVYNGIYIWAYIKFSSPYLSPCSRKLLHFGELGAGSMADHIYRELRIWDGHTRSTRRDSMEYYTKEKHNAEELQSYFTRSGYCASLHEFKKGVFTLHLSTLKVRQIKKKNVTYLPGGKFACLSVPDEFLLVRQNGYTFLSGNCQQQPKTRGYLECFKPRPGRVWVDHDFTALEPCVLTELSRDESMLKIYGPAASEPQLSTVCKALDVKGIPWRVIGDTLEILDEDL